ncbi:MAG: EamA family transporter [Armatimonadetes bacterium]|nr:EamA family transporter [Armatimonadota bacterium]
MIWGAGLALASAATFGFNNAALRRGVLQGSVLQALAITVPMGIPLFLAAAWARGELLALPRFSPPAALALAAAGILHFGIGRYANYRAVAAVGSNLSGTLSEFSVVVSLVLAVGLLKERLSALQILGIIMIFLAFFGVRDDAENLGTKVFRPDMGKGYLYSVLAAVAYGTSPVLVRASLSEVNLPLAGGLISYIAASLAFGAFALASGSLGHIRAVPRPALPWFLLSGVSVGTSQVFRYLALSLAPVTIVSPIQRLSLLFRVLFSTLINPQYEALNRRILLAIFVALLGGVAVALG